MAAHSSASHDRRVKTIETNKQQGLRQNCQGSTTPWRRMEMWRYNWRVLNLHTRRRWVVSFTLPPFCQWERAPLLSLERSVSVLQKRPGQGDERKRLYPCRESKPGRPRIILAFGHSHRAADKLSPVSGWWHRISHLRSFWRGHLTVATPAYVQNALYKYACCINHSTDSSA